MASLYWDEFEKRERETVACLVRGSKVPVRRVAIYITEKCNFRCVYCNMANRKTEMQEGVFDSIVGKYSGEAVLHITGGEPSCVKWLYPYIESHKAKYNLNTNAYLMPPQKNINRMKISFDTHIEDEFNSIVRRGSAFKRVVGNVRRSTETSIVSLTCVLSKRTYRNTPKLTSFVNREFPKLYAIFFSLYKGIDPALAMTKHDVDTFFEQYVPRLEANMQPESLSLFRETLDNKLRLNTGIRFPENDISKPCYLSMSERVINPSGEEYLCSHLFRDGIYQTEPKKHAKCAYGCNTRLVRFNNDVEAQLR